MISVIAGRTIEEVASREETLARWTFFRGGAVHPGVYQRFVRLGTTASVFRQLLYRYFASLALVAHLASFWWGRIFGSVPFCPVVSRDARRG